MAGVKACFIDRDGVINEVVDRGHYLGGDGRVCRYSAPWCYSEFQLRPRVKEALLLLGRLGLVRVLVTSQPDVAYGHLSPQDHAQIMSEVAALPWDDIYVCPHRRSDNCSCKKPKPGLLLAAARKWSINLTASFMVGDMESDIAVGRAVGCRTILIRSMENQNIIADFYSEDLFGAASLIERLMKGV